MREMPTIASSAHAHSTYGMAVGGLVPLSSTVSDTGAWGNAIGNINIADVWHGDHDNNERARQRIKYMALAQQNAIRQPHDEEEDEDMTDKRRLVQVIIADPDENVPLDKCLLYRGDPKLTDATDQELFFEIDIKNILDKHNAERVKLIDKKVKERSEHLEPAKIRDLKMVVVTIAAF